MAHPIEAAVSSYRRVFGSDPDVVAFGPGRINLIGEHTDTSQGFALPCAIPLGVAIVAGAGTEGLYSADFDERASSDGCREDGWAAYPRGVAWALAERGRSIQHYQAAFAGDLPIASGLSSSAAIESATALALDALNGLGIDRLDLAKICQAAENGFVGVQSGLLDQMASLLCRAEHALFIDFRTLRYEQIPAGLSRSGLTLLVCDTRMERPLGSSQYNERSDSVKHAARTLALQTLRDAHLDDLTRLTGVEQKRARHVVSENQRVLQAVDALRRQDFEKLGLLMYASHASLRDDFEVSTPQLDLFVETAQRNGAMGARLTGAGFGGCAIALIHDQDDDRIRSAALNAFKEAAFEEPAFYSVSPSDGARIVHDYR